MAMHACFDLSMRIARLLHVCLRASFMLWSWIFHMDNGDFAFAYTDAQSSGDESMADKRGVK